MGPGGKKTTINHTIWMIKLPNRPMFWIGHKTIPKYKQLQVENDHLD